MKTIGEKIKELLREQGMTQEALARKSNVPYATILKIVGHKVENPTVKTMQRLALALNVPVGDLLVELDKDE